MKTARRLAALGAAALWTSAIAACGPAVEQTPPAPAPPAPVASPIKQVSHRCSLPAPKLSDDACTTDADCGPSDPCHAAACVAKARSHPAGPETACTRNMECHTADANRCGCHQGRCALIPPS